VTVYSSEIVLQTKGEIELLDISQLVRNIIRESSITDGLVNIFHPGSTGAIITMEYEPGLIKDTIELVKKLIPKGVGYQHDCHDDNAHSHLRASLFSPEITIPLANNKLILGTWQQIVFLEFDTRSRKRKIIITIVGDK
jgi:secondary thiamine-phosphate synthase enzyme